MSKSKPKGKNKDKLSVKKMRRMIRREVAAQLGGLRDCLSGEFQVSIGEEMQRRSMMPFMALAVTDAKAGEEVEVRPVSQEARY